MKKVLLFGVALLALTIAIPVVGMAADDQAQVFGALQNLSVETEGQLAPMQDGELASVEGQGWVTYYDYTDNTYKFNFYDDALVIFQSNVFGDNFVTIND